MIIKYAPLVRCHQYTGWFRRKVQYFTDDRIGHCEMKKIVRTCVELRMVTEMELFRSTNTKLLWMVIKEEKLVYVNNQKCAICILFTIFSPTFFGLCCCNLQGDVIITRIRRHKFDCLFDRHYVTVINYYNFS